MSSLVKREEGGGTERHIGRREERKKKGERERDRREIVSLSQEISECEVHVCTY